MMQHPKSSRRFTRSCEADAVFSILDTLPIVKRKDEEKFNGDYRLGSQNLKRGSF